MKAFVRLLGAYGAMGILLSGALLAAPKPASTPEKDVQKTASLQKDAQDSAKAKEVKTPSQKSDAPPDASAPLPTGPSDVSKDTPKSLQELWSAVKVFSLHQDQNQEKIAFEWTVPAEAALFVRGGRAFFVFSQKADFDLTNLTKTPTLWHNFQVLHTEHGSAICVRFDPEAEVHFGKRDAAWTLRLEVPDKGADRNTADEDEDKEQEFPTTLTTQAPIEVEVQLDPALKTQPHPVTVIDPVTKETYIVLPTPKRQTELRRFKDFDILPSIRGLVLLKKGDDFSPRVADKNVVLLSSQVSCASDRDRIRQRAAPPPPVTAKMWQLAQNSEKRIKKLYQEGRFEGDNSNHAEFIHDHKDLALMLMSHGDMGDALNVLDYLDVKEPGTLKDPLVRLLRAIAHAQMGQSDLTSELVKHQADEGEEHAILWQGVADMLEERYHEGLKKTVERMQFLKEYPQAVTNPVYLLMALASYRINYPGLLFLSLIDQSRLIPFEKELYDYLQLFLAPRTKEHDKMLENFAAKSRSIQVRAEATYALVSQNQNKWDAKTQIKHLEDIRFLWRGNSLEMNIAAKLADLYAKETQPEKALFLYRMIKEQFEDFPGYKTLLQRGENYFCDAFMERGNRPLFLTVALYDRFKEMLPEGPRQYKVIEQLSKDYENIGFHSQAQRSLQYLIQKNPENDKKAAYLLELSKVQEKNNDLKGMQSTLAQFKALPPLSDYTLPIRYLEADVLGRSGHKAAALALLGNDATYEGLKHRLHLAWDLSNWSLVRSVLTQLIAHKQATPTDQNKYFVSLAVTLNLLKDRPGLTLLRATFLKRMEKTPQGALFELLTMAPLETPSQATKQAFQAQLAKVQKFQALLSELAKNPEQNS